MNTIVYASNGHIDDKATIKKTVLELTKKPGMIRIEEIRQAINKQISNPAEHLTHKMVVQGVAKMLQTRS